jgi:hypothetical protein
MKLNKKEYTETKEEVMNEYNLHIINKELITFC